MSIRRIQEFLDGNHVRYAVICHSPAYTASEVAESVHIRGRTFAKVVIVAIDGRLALAVVPATCEVDLSSLQDLTGVHDVRLAGETEFADRFQGCKLGTVPPFGNLFGVDTYVDRSLMKEEYIAFNAGTHTDVIVMSFEDYNHLVRAKFAHIAMPPINQRFRVATL